MNKNGVILLILASVLALTRSARIWIPKSRIDRFQSAYQEHSPEQGHEVNSPHQNQPSQAEHIDATISGSVLARQSMADPVIIKQRRPILDLNAEYVPSPNDKENNSANSECGNDEDYPIPMDDNGTIDSQSKQKQKAKEVVDQREEEPYETENIEHELESPEPLKWGRKDHRGSKKLTDSLGKVLGFL